MHDLIKYIRKIFKEDDSLFRTLLYVRNDEYLLKMLQNPLLLILIKKNIQGLFKKQEDDYTFYSKIIGDLILEYNKNIDIRKLDFDLTQYINCKNENEKLKKFITDKLSYFAYKEEMFSFKVKEIQYILSLGLLKTKNYVIVKENAKFTFINEIFHKYFLAHYIANLGLQEFREELEKINKDEIDIFAFLNILLEPKLEQYSILIKYFSKIVDNLEIEEQIRILARTQIDIDITPEKIKEYEKKIETIDSNIDKRSLTLKIKDILAIKNNNKYTIIEKNSKGLER